MDVVTVTLNPAIDQTISISNFAVGQVNRVEEIRATPGGKGVNVACAVADFGAIVAATGFMGEENRTPFDALFAARNITNAFVPITGKTRFGIKIIDPVQDGTTDINYPGLAPSPADVLKLQDRLKAFDAPWFVLAGSLPPGVDPAIYRELTEALRGSNRKVVLDTSGAPLKYALEAAPSVVKPNIDELEALLGRPLATESEIVAAAKALVSRGIEMVVVSMGAAGACFVTAEEAIIARSPEVSVKSTVGAGDAMVAGIVISKLHALSLSQCARLAVAFSADAVSRIEPGLTSVAAVEELTKRVGVVNVG